MNKLTLTHLVVCLLITHHAFAKSESVLTDSIKNNFLVHITAYADQKNLELFPNLKNVSFKEDNKGIWHYYLGAYRSLEEADSVKNAIVKLGYIYAYIIDVEKVRKECKAQCNKDEATCPQLMQKIRSVSHLLFSFNSADLSNKSKELLQTLYQIMSENNKYKVELKGHTDGVGTPEYNQELSEKRSGSSAQFLKKLGITNDRISETSYGMESPIAKNVLNGRDCPEGRKFNRRVEIFITDTTGNVLNALVEPLDIPTDFLYAGR